MRTQIFIGIITVPCNLLPTCDVDVWLVSLEADSENGPVGDPERLLSADEKLRAARFRFEADRARWSRARSALRAILASYTSTPAEDLRFVIGPHGKPGLAGAGPIEFSLSHACNWAMVAVTRNVPVGIDIERVRDDVDIAALLRRLGIVDPQASRRDLFHAWNRREAMTKAMGGALLDKPTGNFCACDLDAPEGYSAALATAEISPRVRYRSTTPVTDSTANRVS